MYRTIKRTPTSLNVNETMEGETIEKMIERRLNNGETAQDNIMKDLIYQGKFDWNILLGMIGIISEITGEIKKATLNNENND